MSLDHAWQGAVEALCDPASALRRQFADLPAAARLSAPGLEEGLRCLARGVRPEVFAALRARPTAPAGGHDVVILAGNLPALFLQPLARSLAARRTVLLKPASQDCGLAAAFVADLVRRLPELSSVIACRPWHGGDAAIEAPLFAAADRVIAYGDAPAMASLQARTGAKLIQHGPKSSLALLAGPPHRAVADGLARDIALFDQRGCLSVGVVLAPAASIDAWAVALHAALRRISEALPPGAPSPNEALAAHQARAEAAMRGARVLALDQLADGAVLVERDAVVDPTPVLRTVQLVPFETSDGLISRLAPSRRRWQGLALAGVDPTWADALVRATAVSRVAPVGELQHADATWDDGEPTNPC